MYKQEVINPILFTLVSCLIYNSFGVCVLIIILRNTDFFYSVIIILDLHWVFYGNLIYSRSIFLFIMFFYCQIYYLLKFGLRVLYTLWLYDQSLVVSDDISDLYVIYFRSPCISISKLTAKSYSEFSLCEYSRIGYLLA